MDDLGSPGYTEVDGVGLGTATDNDGYFCHCPYLFPLTKHTSSRLPTEQPKRVWLLPLPQRAPIPSGLRLREARMAILNPFKGSPLCGSAVKQVAAEKRC